MEEPASFWLVASTIGGILAALFGGLGLVFLLMGDKGSYEQIRDWAMRPGRGARYRALIKWGLGRASRFYGTAQGISFEGYTTCLLLALVYPIVIWLLAWAMNGPTTIAGVAAFDEVAPAPIRWVVLALLAALTLGMGIWNAKFGSISEFLSLRVSWLFGRSILTQNFTDSLGGTVSAFVILGVFGTLVLLVSFVALVGLSALGALVSTGVVYPVGAVVVIGAAIPIGAFVALGTLGTVIAAGTVGTLIAVVMIGAEYRVDPLTALGVFGALITLVATGSLFAVGAFRNAGAGLTFGGVLVAGATTVFSKLGTVTISDAADAVVLFTFLLIIPIANAALDHVSVQVSRFLLQDMLRRRASAHQWLIVTWHITADVVFAVIFLVLLAILLPVVMQATNHGFDALGLPSVEWLIYLNAARHDPFGEGWLVTGMLATTLFPTALHLLAAGGALILPRIGGGVIKRLAEKDETTLLDRIIFVGAIAVTVLLSWGALAGAATGLWHLGNTYIGPLGTWLADVAEWSGRAVGGPGLDLNP